MLFDYIANVPRIEAENAAIGHCAYPGSDHQHIKKDMVG
jgi:hypothetical protein